MPRCILGQYVCGQREELLCPNLETHTYTHADENERICLRSKRSIKHVMKEEML